MSKLYHHRNNNTDRSTNNDTHKLEEKATAIRMHYNSRPIRKLADRRESPIIHLRRFCNARKRAMLQQTVHPNDWVLDMCSGPGVDMKKFKDFKAAKVVLIDEVDKSIEEAIRRYESMRKDENEYRHEHNSRVHPRRHLKDFTVNCLVANCHAKLPPGWCGVHQYDVVNCQFALHYACSSVDKLMGLLENVDRCLRPDRYFVGTIPSDTVILERLRAAMEKKRESLDVKSKPMTDADGDDNPATGELHSSAGDDEDRPARRMDDGDDDEADQKKRDDDSDVSWKRQSVASDDKDPVTVCDDKSHQRQRHEEQRITPLNAKTSDLVFGNEVYSVKPVDAAGMLERPTEFGHEYRFNLLDAIDDCPEFLVPWQRFVEICEKKMRWKLVISEPFSKFERDRQGMSDAEWEAATLYRTFVFRKL